MSRLTSISNAIAEKLKEIDGSAITPKYTFNSVTGSVDIPDETITSQLDQFNNTTDNINYTVNKANTIFNLEWGDTNNIITNSIEYTIIAQVKNKNVTNVEFTSETIEDRCSDVIDDIIYVFVNDYSLDALVNYVKFDSATIFPLTTNDGFRAANVIVKLTVKYNQSLSNPAVGR